MTQKEKKPRKGFREFVRNRKAASALLFALAYVAVITLCVTSITPERYALSVGDIAKKTITASKDVVDEVTTQQRRDAAAAQAAPVYYKDEGVKEIVLADVEKAFEEIGEDVYKRQGVPSSRAASARSARCPNIAGRASRDGCSPWRRRT